MIRQSLNITIILAVILRIECVSQLVWASDATPNEGSYPAGLYAHYHGDGLKFSGNRIVSWANSAPNKNNAELAKRDLSRIHGEPRPFRIKPPSTARTVVRLDGRSALWQPVSEWGKLDHGRTIVMAVRLNKDAEGFLFDGSTNSGLTRAQIRSGRWQVGIQPPPISNAANNDIETLVASNGAWSVHGFVFDHSEKTSSGLHVQLAKDQWTEASFTCPSTNSLGGLIVGSNAATQLGLECDVGEILVFDRALAKSDLKRVSQALMTRWSDLVDLPDDQQPRPEQVEDDPRVFRTVLRRPGDDGSKAYRIPGLATSPKGTLLAVFDIRYDGGGDLPANIDVGLMRSTDQGETWEPMQKILDFDKAEPNSRGNGVGDPAILVDHQTGTIFVAALWSKGNRAWNGSGPGLTPEETGQFVLTRSNDDGKTWSEPINITTQIKSKEWRLCFNGPGAGIQTRNGSLIFPAQFRDTDGTAHSCFIHSNDHGSTWSISPPAIPGKRPTSESQIVELDDGSLLLTMRDESRSGKRAWARWIWKASDKRTGATDNTGDGKQLATHGHWSEPWFTVPDPTCMASMMRHPHGKLIFSNPNSSTQRIALTLRTSNDGGVTWSDGRLLDPRGCMYSCMTTLSDGRIGIVYEVAGTLTFARFPLAWISEGSPQR